MIGWLWRMIVGNLCNHKWETMAKRRDLMDGEFVGYSLHLRCTKCGDWKRRELR